MECKWNNGSSILYLFTKSQNGALNLWTSDSCSDVAFTFINKGNVISYIYVLFVILVFHFNTIISNDFRTNNLHFYLIYCTKLAF